MIFSEPSGSIPCVASLAITWVNLPTRVNRHRCISRGNGHATDTLSMVEPHFTEQNGQQHGELFHRCRGLLLDHSGMEAASSRFIIESSGI